MSARQPATILCPCCGKDAPKYPLRKLCVDCGKEYTRRQADQQKMRRREIAAQERVKVEWDKDLSNDYLGMKL